MELKAVILAGGMGTRISEETHLRPKPMIEIGGRPILWHIMKIYAHYGIDDFVICLGYKGYVIKEYFANYVLHSSDVTIDAIENTITYHNSSAEPWRVTLVNTGQSTMTGGRLKRVRPYLNPAEPFCFTYGDGVADIDIGDLVAFHSAHGKRATVTAVAPPGRFGALSVGDNHQVNGFIEKPQNASALINGGFFVLEPSVIDLIENDDTPWEAEPMTRLTEQGELVAYHHPRFWHAMDTLRDQNQLESLWSQNCAPWNVWD